MAFLGNINVGQSTLGSRVGKDLGDVLQNLAHHKATQKIASEKAKLWQSLGIDPQTAQSLVHQPEKVQQAFFDRWEQPQQQQQQPMQQSDIQSSFTPEQMNMLKTIPNPMDRQKVAQGFLQQNQGQNQVSSTQPSERIGQAAVQQQNIEKAAQVQQGGLRPLNYAEQQKAIRDAYLDQRQEQKEIEKEQRKEKYELAKYERQRFDKKQDESKDFLKELNKKSKAVKEANARLERMEVLTRSGKLDSPGFSSGLDAIGHGLWGVGISLKHLQSPESQEFEKLSKDMLSGIKDIFGSRILKTEVDTFLKTIPNLQQSNEGKIAVIENLKLLNDAKLAQQKVAREIIKENDGIVPPDLELMVDDKLDDYLDDIHKKFVNQIHTPVKNKGGLLPVLGFITKSANVL